MRRRTFTVIGALSIFIAPLLTSGQQIAKVPYVGYMTPGHISRYDNAFLEGLQEQGYILPGEVPRYDDAFWKGLAKRGSFEGKKIRIEIRSTLEDYPKRAPALADELVRLNVDVIFSASAPEVEAVRQAVQRAHKAIPIVFGPQFDPVGEGLIASLARPGGNITGLVLSDLELEAKRLEVLLETFPRLSRVAYLDDPTFVPPELNVRMKEAVWGCAVRGSRWSYVLWNPLRRLPASCGRYRGQDPEWDQAKRHSRGTT